MSESYINFGYACYTLIIICGLLGIIVIAYLLPKVLKEDFNGCFPNNKTGELLIKYSGFLFIAILLLCVYFSSDIVSYENERKRSETYNEGYDEGYGRGYSQAYEDLVNGNYNY